MQIVIEIHNQIYENAKNDLLCGAGIITNAIKNGTPLPEHHGRLIDAGVLENKLSEVFKAVGEVPTIIPATKEGD